MNYPKVSSVKAIDEHTLLVQFSNQDVKQYDVAPLLSKPVFSALKNPALFKNVKIEAGGYAVSWNDEIDISEYELWVNGVAQRDNG